MASPKTLEMRAERQKARIVRQAERNKARLAAENAQQQHQQGQVAAQFITSLARDIYQRTVTPWSGSTPSVEELYKYYEEQAHVAMDAAIAFVRASNSYDDRGKVAKDAPPIVAETPAVTE